MVFGTIRTAASSRCLPIGGNNGSAIFPFWRRWIDEDDFAVGADAVSDAVFENHDKIPETDAMQNPFDQFCLRCLSMVEPDFSSAGIVGKVHACACNVLESTVFHTSAFEIEVIAAFVGFAEAVSFFPGNFLHEQGHPYPVAEGIQFAPVKISIEFGAAAHGIGERQGAVADLPNAVGDGKVPKRPVAHRTREMQETLKFGLRGRFAGEERRQQQQQNERFAKEAQAKTADHGKQDREFWGRVGLVRFANSLGARCLSWQSTMDVQGFGADGCG